jgi:hypothetical protein
MKNPLTKKTQRYIILREVNNNTASEQLVNAAWM